MNKKKMLIGIFALFFIGIMMTTIYVFSDQNQQDYLETGSLVGRVLASDQKSLTIQDANQGIYTLNKGDYQVEIGHDIAIEFSGVLNRDVEFQSQLVINSLDDVSQSSLSFPDAWQDNGIFQKFYAAAFKKIKTMSLDEKIHQILLVRYPDQGVEVLKNNPFGGYVFFAKDFASKNADEVKKMLRDVQNSSKIPMITAVDEEGGKVVRISSNSNLVEHPFKSSQELYQSGGFSLIREDTIEKSRILKNLGLNVNLAPVVDVSTDPNSYMYSRTLGQNTEVTSQYAKTVIKASQGSSVSYVLKHFPGYGNNSDTHQGASTDTRTIENLKDNDFPPFAAGIEAGAEAVLISHNTLTNVDANNPASLSPTIHNLLRNELGFTGIIITDDLAMGATANIQNAVVKAIKAGNDMIIVTDYNNSIRSIKTALDQGDLDESIIDKLAFRVLAWKYYKGLLFENEK